MAGTKQEHFIGKSKNNFCVKYRLDHFKLSVIYIEL